LVFLKELAKIIPAKNKGNDIMVDEKITERA